MCAKLKNLFLLISLLDLIWGCGQNKDITVKQKNNPLGEDSPNSTQADVINIKEDSPSFEIPFSIASFSTVLANKHRECSPSFFSYKSSNQSLIAVSGALKVTGTFPNCMASFVPAANASGTSTVVLSFSYENKSKSTSFVLIASPVNDAPTIAVISSLSTHQDSPVDVSFSPDDVDGALLCTNTNLLYSSDNPALVASTDALAWSGTWPNCVGRITPVANAFGTARITFIVDDGYLSASRSFTLSVSEGQ